MPQDTAQGDIGSLKQILAIKANDEKALRHLYQTNYSTVERYVLDNSGTGDEAKDVYQEAFIAAWQNIKSERFKPQPGSSLEGYLFQIAKYKWLDYLRVKKRNKVVRVVEDILLEETWNEEEQIYMEKVQHHFKSLGEPCRQVLTLFYFTKQSMEKIAGVFSWTAATAKNNKYRCLQRLRNMVVQQNK